MKGRWKGLVRVLALVAVLGAGALLVRYSPLGDYFSREGITRGVALLRESSLAPLIFVPIYACAVALAIPGTLPTLAGGAVFGLWWGTLFNWMGAVIGANLAYLLARYLGREGISQLVGNRMEAWPAMDRLDRAVREHGFRGMLTLRLIPVVPFNALNFGGGLVGMEWTSYTVSTAMGILPGTFVYTMFADALLEGSTQASRQAFIRMAVAGAALLLLSFLPLLLRKMGIRVSVLPGQAGSDDGAPDDTTGDGR